jgi:hypothetical protein
MNRAQASYMLVKFYFNNPIHTSSYSKAFFGVLGRFLQINKSELTVMPAKNLSFDVNIST